jgi:hypothetical protein
MLLPLSRLWRQVNFLTKKSNKNPLGPGPTFGTDGHKYLTIDDKGFVIKHGFDNPHARSLSYQSGLSDLSQIEYYDEFNCVFGQRTLEIRIFNLSIMAVSHEINIVPASGEELLSIVPIYGSGHFLIVTNKVIKKYSTIGAFVWDSAPTSLGNYGRIRGYNSILIICGTGDRCPHFN